MINSISDLRQRLAVAPRHWSHRRYRSTKAGRPHWWATPAKNLLALPRSAPVDVISMY